MIGYYKILSRVPCAIQCVLMVIYFIYSSVYTIIPFLKGSFLVMGKTLYERLKLEVFTLNYVYNIDFRIITFQICDDRRFVNCHDTSPPICVIPN